MVVRRGEADGDGAASAASATTAAGVAAATGGTAAGSGARAGGRISQKPNAKPSARTRNATNGRAKRMYGTGGRRQSATGPRWVRSVEDADEAGRRHRRLHLRVRSTRRGAAHPDAGRDGAPRVGVAVVALVGVVLVRGVEVEEPG